MRIPLFKRDERPKVVGDRLEAVAGHGTDIGNGLKMFTAQAANEVLRHCRIGRIWQK
jgi:hypothetical protein